jgi:hypothetical protein
MTKLVLGLASVPIIAVVAGLGVMHAYNRKAHASCRMVLEPPARPVSSHLANSFSGTPSPVPDYVTSEDGSVNYGRYCGRIANVNIQAQNLPFPFWGPLKSLRHKKWQFHTVETDTIFLTMAILHAGYATKAVFLAYDKVERVAFGLDETAPLNFGLVSFGSSSIDSKTSTIFSFGNNRLEFSYQDNTAWKVSGQLKLKDLGGTGKIRRVTVEINISDAVASMDQLAVVYPFTEMSPAYTHKAMCLPTSGSIQIGDKFHSLEGSQGSIDWSSVYAPYLTRWRWLFVSGITSNGKKFGINLSSQDQYDEHENSIWIDGQMSRGGAVAFTLPAEDLLEDPEDKTKWEISSVSPSPSAGINLSFTPVFKKFVPMSTGIVDSRYMQVLGHVNGTIKIGENTFEIKDTFGIAERQICMW